MKKLIEDKSKDFTTKGINVHIRSHYGTEEAFAESIVKPIMDLAYYLDKFKESEDE